ncbi:Translesion DNA polymerase-REV1 deoxycytidyl transferase [Phaffia rhodozyma]|uniref:Translesion DNA polymerase-REV1 deoxycytidyl transferase n=1 Tax=Phaffia rhodozyma TaxID=264483 RepID=A0A0F7SKF3_PHARH|nr:Translesion DNA polymerase-REV1 deoxycytidyl transferase [Phaffia rhodozyma]
MGSENGEKPSARTPNENESKDRKRLTRNQLIHKLITTTDLPSNPITHASRPVDVVVSCSTGHQVSSHGGGKKRAELGNYMKAREQKIKNQVAGKKNDLFRGVIAWIDGYTGPTITNLELKDLVHSNGGLVAMYPGKKVTHILTAASLSGSKTHALLTKTVGWKPVVVDPMWIVECVNSGKRIGSEKWKIGGIGVNQPSIGQFITRPGSTSSSISKSIQPRANLTRPSSRIEVIDLCDSDNN